MGRALALLGAALVIAGWIWQTYTLLRQGWKQLKASLAHDPAFATVCAGALLATIGIIFS